MDRLANTNTRVSGSNIVCLSGSVGSDRAKTLSGRSGGVLGALLLSCLAACGAETPSSDDTGGGGAPTATGGAFATGGADGSAATGGASGGTLGSGGDSAEGSGGTSSGGSSPDGSGGTDDGASGGSGSGGSTAFSPCPTDAPCKILPLGDSITEGMLRTQGGQYVFEGGYRVELFSRAIEAGKDITFVGSKMNGPDTVGGRPFPKNNEGYSGYTIQQIINLPNKLSGEPHIVLLHIGTNDLNQGQAASAPQRLEALIDQITTALPDTLLVVSNIIPFPLQSSGVTTYNAAIPPIVEARAQAGAHVLFVDQFTGFPTTELPDSVHPDEAGYARMGRTWFEAIESYLP